MSKCYNPCCTKGIPQKIAFFKVLVEREKGLEMYQKHLAHDYKTRTSLQRDILYCGN